MSSYQMKMIAIVTMTIDHIAKILGQSFWLKILPGAIHQTYWIVTLMGAIGRIAYPLFAFMLVEGCRKTHSFPRYAARLAIFALLSQPFYNLAFVQFGNTWEEMLVALKSTMNFKFNNVLVTLLLGAINIKIYSILFHRRFVNKIVTIFIIISSCFLAEYRHLDYGAFGILLIMALYVSKTISKQSIVLIIWSIVFYLFGFFWTGGTVSLDSFFFLQYLIPCLFAASSVLAIRAYNGLRGRSMKWFFYIYYPVHILCLMVISNLLL